LQAHAGVGELGGIGVPKLVRGHIERPGVGPGKAGSRSREPEALADAPGLETPPVLGEQEVGGNAGAGVWMGALRASLAGPGVEGGDGAVIEGNGPFGAELAERDLQPCSRRPVVDNTAELEIEAFAEAETGAA